MRPTDEIQPVKMVELLRHLRAKKIPRTSGADQPRVPDLLGIRPHHVAECSFVWYLPVALDRTDLANTHSDIRYLRKKVLL